MTDKELVVRLRLNANRMMDEWEPALCKRSEFITAADRIEQLCAELTQEKIDNTKLKGELATVAAERDRYKAERDAAEREILQPLTLEELRRMDGQPVWCATSCGIFACIVQIKRHRDDCGDITLVHDVHFTFAPDENSAIYRTKPKEAPACSK